MRLNNQIKHAVLRDLLNNRFKDDCKRMVDQYKEAARDAYMYVYGESTIKKMYTLPEGWLNEEVSIRLLFDEPLGFVNFYFNGSTSLIGTEISNIYKKFNNIDSVYKRVLDMKKSKIFPLNHNLEQSFSRIKMSQTILTEEIKYARKHAISLLFSQTGSTDIKLISVWPEIEPFLIKHLSKPKINLPTITNKQLNKVFNL